MCGAGSGRQSRRNHGGQMKTQGWLCAALLASLVAAPVIAQGQAQGKSEAQAWPALTVTAKPWTRWWWPGSAVDKANLTKQLEAIVAAGIGGVEITPIY